MKRDKAHNSTLKSSQHRLIHYETFLINPFLSSTSLSYPQRFTESSPEIPVVKSFSENMLKLDGYAYKLRWISDYKRHWQWEGRGSKIWTPLGDIQGHTLVWLLLTNRQFSNLRNPFPEQNLCCSSRKRLLSKASKGANMCRTLAVCNTWARLSYITDPVYSLQCSVMEVRPAPFYKRGHWCSERLVPYPR